MTHRHEEKAGGIVLPGEDMDRLLKLARGTLSRYLETRRKPVPADLGVQVTEALRQVAGAFVTLHKGGDLRGCIGEIFPEREVYKAVMDHALNAGLKDPRFPTVAAAELKSIDFEISVLTPPWTIPEWSEIEIGRHGIVLSKDRRMAVFLPQVAPEQGWDLETTLTHLAWKAGLDGDDWREDAEFRVFEAIVFGEKD